MSNLTELDLWIMLFSISTTFWLVKLQRMAELKYPSLAPVALVLSFITSLAGAEYVIMRLNNELSGDIITYLILLDSAAGFTSLVLASLFATVYVVYPILERVAGQESARPAGDKTAQIKRPTTIRDVALGSIFLLIIGWLTYSTYGYLRDMALSQCNQLPSLTCLRFTRILELISNYVSTMISLDIRITQVIILLGAIAAIVGTTKTSLELLQIFGVNFNPRKTKALRRPAKKKSRA